MRTRSTIYDVLCARLGRVPTHAEQKTEVARIIGDVRMEVAQALASGLGPRADWTPAAIRRRALAVRALKRSLLSDDAPPESTRQSPETKGERK